MRYTTVIDISEMPAVYRNVNARLVYIHLCLKAGYHDNDRDLVSVSIRALAEALSLTLSATRHALQVLENAGLVMRQGQLLWVRKWVQEQPISTRARTARQQEQLRQQAAARQAREARERELEIERLRRQADQQAGKSQFVTYYEDLQKRAAAGDAEAARLVEQRKGIYEAAVMNLQKNQQNELNTP